MEMLPKLARILKTGLRSNLNNTFSTLKYIITTLYFASFYKPKTPNLFLIRNGTCKKSQRTLHNYTLLSHPPALSPRNKTKTGEIPQQVSKSYLMAEQLLCIHTHIHSISAVCINPARLPIHNTSARGATLTGSPKLRVPHLRIRLSFLSSLSLFLERAKFEGKAFK